MTGAPLFVPIRCDALLINGQVAAQNDFRLWNFDYDNLPFFGSPTPGLFDDLNQSTPPAGVHLHWTLPRALRTRPSGASGYPLVPNRWLIVRMAGGTPRGSMAWIVESDCPSATPDHGSQYLIDPAVAAAWDASSDPNRRGSGLSATATEPQAPTLGRTFPLSEWKEAAAEAMFLTAVAASNPVFSEYVQHNRGIFSFYDDLAGVPGCALSYYVVGWFSDPAHDILAPGQAGHSAYTQVLAALGWSPARVTPGICTHSLYGGTVYDIPWNPDPGAPAPPGDPLSGFKSGQGMDVAVGNSAVDAFMALAAPLIDDAGQRTCLRALLYDAIGLLNQPGGDVLLDEKATRSWFSSKPGGTRWVIVAESSPESDIVLAAEEAAWLRQLNLDQAAHDTAVAELFALQWQLQARWTQYHNADCNIQYPFYPDDFDQSDQSGQQNPRDPRDFTAFMTALRADFDGTTAAGTTAARVVAAFQTVQAGRARLPQASPAVANRRDAFQEGIQVFARKKGLGAGKLLKAVAAEPFHASGDPVVVISGVAPAPATRPDEAIDVRSIDDLVAVLTAGGTVIDTGVLARAVSLPGVPAGLPHGVSAFLTECGLLDPVNASALGLGKPIDATDAALLGKGIPPDYGRAPWSQPWQPMFMEWKVRHVATASTFAGQPCWAFDGNDYAITAAGLQALADAEANGERHSLNGIALLGPQAQVIVGARLGAFVKAFGGAAQPGLADLEKEIGEVPNWEFLTQELSGFGSLLALRDPRAFRRPSPHDTVGAGSVAYPLAPLTGYVDAGSKTAYDLPEHLQGQASTIPLLQLGRLPFSGSRQGKAYFTDLMIYDKFGRVLTVVGDSGLHDHERFPLDIDPALRRGAPPEPVEHSLYLPPRLLQHARLNFDLIDARDDAKLVDIDQTANPICGFVLPNHLDQSVSVYGADGGALGEFRLLARSDGTSVGAWQAVPNGAIGSIEDLASVSPHLADMLRASGIQRAEGFRAFLSAIDVSLWTIDPLGNRVDQNLSVLVGRPLALIRARLQVELDGPPIQDPTWFATSEALAGTLSPAAFTAMPIAIRVGDQATRQDGVVGYFAGDDYATFNAVAPAEAGGGDPYIRPIGPIGGPGGNFLTVTCTDAGTTVSILADPRAAMHAVTGLLPVRRVAIPARFIARPLRAIAVGFRMGPILTAVQQTPAPPTHAPAHAWAVTIPRPAEQHGTWSWWEPGARSGPWTGYDVIPAVANARLGPLPNTLREGTLQLTIDASRDSKSEGD